MFDFDIAPVGYPVELLKKYIYKFVSVVIDLIHVHNKGVAKGLNREMAASDLYLTGGRRVRNNIKYRHLYQVIFYRLSTMISDETS